MIPGWDCHGLPIELKALERLKGGKDKNTTATATALSAQEIRKHARNLYRSECVLVSNSMCKTGRWKQSTSSATSLGNGTSWATGLSRIALSIQRTRPPSSVCLRKW